LDTAETVLFSFCQLNTLPVSKPHIQRHTHRHTQFLINWPFTGVIPVRTESPMENLSRKMGQVHKASRHSLYSDW